MEARSYANTRCEDNGERESLSWDWTGSGLYYLFSSIVCFFSDKFYVVSDVEKDLTHCIMLM